MWVFTVFLGGCGCLAETGSCFQVWTSKYFGYRSFTGHLQVVDMLEFQWIFISPEYSCKIYLSMFLQEIPWIEQPSGKTCFTIHRKTSAVPGCFGGNLGISPFGSWYKLVLDVCVCVYVLFPSSNAMYWSRTRISSKVSWMNIPCQTWKF